MAPEGQVCVLLASFERSGQIPVRSCEEVLKEDIELFEEANDSSAGKQDYDNLILQLNLGIPSLP
jgi:NAD-dependent SIR2 family protein deacetylase